MTEIGKPEESPEIVIIPREEPVPRKQPVEIPQENPELVPA